MQQTLNDRAKRYYYHQHSLHPNLPGVMLLAATQRVVDAMQRGEGSANCKHHACVIAALFLVAADAAMPPNDDRVVVATLIDLFDAELAVRRDMAPRDRRASSLCCRCCPCPCCCWAASSSLEAT